MEVEQENGGQGLARTPFQTSAPPGGVGRGWGGGGHHPPLDPPSALKKTGPSFLPCLWPIKIFFGAFGASQLRPTIFFGAFVAFKNSAPLAGGGGVDQRECHIGG